MSHLFSPYALGPLELANRIAIAEGLFPCGNVNGLAGRHLALSLALLP